MSEKFQNQYRISSARASWHKYNGGVYFITICTAGRAYYFGDVVATEDMLSQEPQMQLSEIGRFAYEQLINVTSHYPYAEIPSFVVMPNHIHAVVVIDGTFGKKNDDCAVDCRDVARNVSTGEKSGKMSSLSPKSNTLSVVVRGIKSSITRFSRKNNIVFDWQSRFHDHIVRDQEELNRIVEYIENNVKNWYLDELNAL